MSKLFRFFFLTVCLIIASISFASPVTSHFVIVGDSEACAAGSVTKEVLRELGRNDPVLFSCRSGSTIQWWDKHIQEVFKTHGKTDVVIVFLGTNHYLQDRLPDMRRLLNEIKDNSKHCVWVGNFAVQGKKWPINNMLKNTTSHVCDYYDAERAPIKLWDGIHPDVANAKLLVKDILKAKNL